MTETRLVAALFFGAVGFAFYWLADPLLASVRAPAFFLVLCVGSGVVTGWMLIGKSTDTIRVGVGQGLTTALAHAVAILLLSGFFNAMRDAMQFRTGEPMGTVAAVFEKAADYFFILATPEIIGLVFVGGVVGGVLVGFVGRVTPD